MPPAAIDEREATSEAQRLRALVPRRRSGRGGPTQETVPRYKQERCFSWLQRKYRRLVVRWERLKVCFDAFLLLACSYIWFPKLVG